MTKEAKLKLAQVQRDLRKTRLMNEAEAAVHEQIEEILDRRFQLERVLSQWHAGFLTGPEMVEQINKL